MAGMTYRERLNTVFGGGTPDHTPVLGGWISCPDHIAAIAGVSLDEYWQDPLGVSIRAYQILGTDGVIDICIPKGREDFRIVDASSYVHADLNESLEDAVLRIEAMPDGAQIEASFDMESEYAVFKKQLLHYQQLCGDMVYLPAQWDAGARVTWYGEFGYENYFSIIGLYPELACKLIEIGGAQGYCKGLLVARAIGEGLLSKALLFGEDICTQRGPMVSPAFLEKHYAQHLKHGLEPLLAAGCRPVWHCDGDVRPLLDMLIDCGVQGFQGFQPECGMKVEQIARRRTREGNKLLIFGALAVTTELPVMTAEQVKHRTWEIIDACGGNADLALFTSNTINPDVPLENILAMYEAAAR